MTELRWALDLGRRLRALRLDRGLTQEALAESAHVHPGYVQKIENGRRLPSLPTLMRMARALNVPLAAVVSVLDGQEPGDVEGVDALLRAATPRELGLIRDFVLLLRRHRFDGTGPVSE